MKPIRVFLLLTLLAVVALASTPADTLIDGWYELIECRVDLTKDIIGDVADNVPEAEYLKDHIDVLDKDLSTLAGINVVEDFREYVRDTYRPHQRDAFEDIRDARLKFVEWNVSEETNKLLRENARRYIDEFRQCKFGALGKIADAKILRYDNIIARFDEHVSNFSGRHPEVDVSGMEQVISDVENDFMEKFRDAVDAAENSEEMVAAINGYCLGNGCTDGVNFHFYAKFAHAKLSAILSAISGDAEENGLGDEVDEAQGYLDAADDALIKVGTEEYTDETRAEVWDNLKDAADTIKDIVKQLYGVESG